MIIGILKELQEHESRVSVTPEMVKKIIKTEHSILVESGAGIKSFISDSEYEESGATIVNSLNDIYQTASDMSTRRVGHCRVSGHLGVRYFSMSV